jgi:hypothetical protein
MAFILIKGGTVAVTWSVAGVVAWQKDALKIIAIMTAVESLLGLTTNTSV